MNKIFFRKLNINFSFNNTIQLTKLIPNNKLFYFILNNSFNKLIKLVEGVFFFNKNVLFVDFNFNFNYLPITNKILFSRSSKYFNKFLKYFNVSIVFFFNLNKKKFIFKKLLSNNVINISLDKDTYLKKFDLNLPISNNYLTNYILYISIMGVYITLKNKNLKINGSALFFF